MTAPASFWLADNDPAAEGEAELELHATTLPCGGGGVKQEPAVFRAFRRFDLKFSPPAAGGVTFAACARWSPGILANGC